MQASVGKYKKKAIYFKLMEIMEVRSRVTEFSRLTLSELREFHYQFEIAFASAIKQAGKGSSDRAALVAEAYTILPSLLLEMRKRQNVNQLDSLGATIGTHKFLMRWFSKNATRVLDVGCGTGYNVLNLLQSGYDAYGIDVSESMILNGIKRAHELYNRDISGHLFAANFINWRPPKDLDLFDIVWTNDVIEHLPEDEAPDFLSKVLSLLKPKGNLVLITPNSLVGPSDASGIKQPIGSRSRGLHLREYSLNELSTLLLDAGFTNLVSPIMSINKFGFDLKPKWIYWKIKILIEPLFNFIPGRLRKYLMIRLQYSTLIAQKP